MSERKGLAFSDLSVLLAEDEAVTSRMALRALRSIGVQSVMRVEDGSAAVKAILEGRAPFDLIIADWKTPKMNGLDLLKTVRQEAPAMPFFMLIGQPSEELIRAMRQHRIDACIVKPFTADQLKAKIAAVLGIRRE